MVSVDDKKAKLLELAVKTLTEEDDDECTVAGKRIAFQLRGMEERQKVIAEKLISDVMFYGKLGKLDEDTIINLSNKI